MNGRSDDLARRARTELVMDVIALLDLAVLSIGAAAFCAAALTH